MKKKLIPLLTLTIILCSSVAAYAVTMSGSSSIQTGYINMTCTSTTTTSESWAKWVLNDFYQDGILRNNSENSNLTGTSVSTSCNALNIPGTQVWECYGEHGIGLDDGTELIKYSYATKNW
ncbi:MULTISPECIES: hypothetical protein [Dehalobacter]|jgi:exopolysaccharide biosynthesis protein|uniref:Ig-like domain-containing protein n=2 Tax=Dehalobacter restrictus TaxID=55583 RepID=A0A857DH67_9FIRM|nr:MULTISPECIES: hypothetical protein [Dehalobacter]AHF11316.1 hypothetical protein DEHRE_05695 [Dehalobacter restrictus DSM 9455]MCG1026527.1 hypothetical protein [Dehalobacter sp.]MDJ0304316.1 hypothetical protein [Dehalobacter sp.]OCZ54980.1 hypothetical protein A7D23_04370 [Dehalobacter sp. TeCB1]QHA00237.1 hypothetical protein GQ588_06010 [Dehalobacter restrictus]